MLKVNLLRQFSLVSLFVFGLLFIPYINVACQPDDNVFDPVSIYLTWQADPTRTMTIDWHTLPEDELRESILQYRILDDSNWWETTGRTFQFPFSDRLIHRVELRDLEPGTIYEFRFGDDSKKYRFETMPVDLKEPIRFVVGGDTHADERFRRMNDVVMEYEPDFILWGGDLAYANANPKRVDRWHNWFEGIKETLIYDDGRVIPIIVAIGNHEVFLRHRQSWTSEESDKLMKKHNLWQEKPAYFFDLFAFPGNPAYGVLDFGEYMSLIVLDSDHHTPVIGGETRSMVGEHEYDDYLAPRPGGQTGWLKDILSHRVERPHIFPIYHVPSYPAHRSFDNWTETRVRENWVPLFEKYGVRVAFENHDHTYKRTHPIKNGKIADDGIVFIGDGSWGAGPRSGSNFDAWYIKKAASVNHGVIVTLNGNKQEYIMVDDNGNIIDTYINDLQLPKRHR